MFIHIYIYITRQRKKEVTTEKYWTLYNPANIVRINIRHFIGSVRHLFGDFGLIPLTHPHMPSIYHMIHDPYDIYGESTNNYNQNQQYMDVCICMWILQTVKHVVPAKNGDRAGLWWVGLIVCTSLFSTQWHHLSPISVHSSLLFMRRTCNILPPPRGKII